MRLQAAAWVDVLPSDSHTIIIDNATIKRPGPSEYEALLHVIVLESKKYEKP